MGPALFYIPLLPVLKRAREAFEPRGVESFSFLDDIGTGMSEVTPNTVTTISFLQHELCERVIAINPCKTVALLPKGLVLTCEEIALLGGIGVRVAEGGRQEEVG